jgi:hypothetical protein
MHSSKSTRDFQPDWWTVEHTTLWQQYSPALRADFDRQAQAEQERARLTRLGPDDVLRQEHAVTPRNIDVERAHAVPDQDWELGSNWEKIEPALRFGVGARAQFLQHERWTAELEQVLREDWETKQPSGSWEKVKHSVRRGFESARRRPS